MNRYVHIRRLGESVSDARLARIVDTVGADVEPPEVAAIAGETLARQAGGVRLALQSHPDRLAAIVDAGGVGVPPWEVATIAAELRTRRAAGWRAPLAIDPASTVH